MRRSLAFLGLSLSEPKTIISEVGSHLDGKMAEGASPTLQLSAGLTLNTQDTGFCLISKQTKTNQVF